MDNTAASPASNMDSIYTENIQVRCEGNGPATGHPLIYLNMEGKNEIMCPYCSQKFIKKQ